MYPGIDLESGICEEAKVILLSTKEINFSNIDLDINLKFEIKNIR